MMQGHRAAEIADVGPLHRSCASPAWRDGPLASPIIRGCTTPVLVMPDDTEPHPYAVAEETAMLARNAQMTFFPWKEAKDRVPLAVRHLRTFLKANRPT